MNINLIKSGRPRLISFSIPFIAAKCQELSSSVFEGSFLNFFEYDMTDGWLYILSGINSSDDSAKIIVSM